MDAGFASRALVRLNRFKLRTECDLVTEEWSTVSIRGPGADQLKIPPDSGVEVAVSPTWPGSEGVDLLGVDVASPDGVPIGDSEAFEILRIMAGVPAMGAELTSDTIPAEAGIVSRSVSFTKGCFTGQELVARIDSRGGNVPRHLRGFTSVGEVPVGATIRIDDVDVGVVTSSKGSVGLAYIKRSIADFPVRGDVDGHSLGLHVLPTL